MKHKINIILILFVTSFVSACLPDPLEVKDIPSLESHIVVSTQIIPDQSVVVLLTKSIGALDAGKESDAESLLRQIIVEDAIVTIQYADVTDTLVNLSNGVYGSVSTPVTTGQSYTLNVNSISMGSVTSTTVAQQAISFQQVDAILYKNEYDSVADITYSLNDPTGRNFYMVNVQKVSFNSNINSLLNQKIFTHVVNDETFDGQRHEEEFKVFFQHYSVGDTVAVSLTNISEEYYDYVKMKVDNRFNIASFATEPFNYPTNVKGGYGFFNIQQPDIRIFILK